MLNKLRTSIDMYKNSGNWDKAAETLKLLADKLNSHEDIFAYAYFCQEQNDFHDAEIYYEKALEIRQRLAKSNPNAYEPDVAATLNNLAFLYSNTQRLTESEKMYKQALEIYQRLALANPKAYEPNVALMQHNLAFLYSQTQRLVESEDMFKQALEIYRRLAKENPIIYQQKIEILEKILEEIR